MGRVGADRPTGRGRYAEQDCWGVVYGCPVYGRAMTISLSRRGRRRGSGRRDDSAGLLAGVLVVAGVLLAFTGGIVVGFPGGGLGPAAGSPGDNATGVASATDRPATGPTAAADTDSGAGPTPSATATPDEPTPDATTEPGGIIPSTATDTETPVEPTMEVVYRVNAGGPMLVPEDDGPAWTADTADDPSKYGNAEESGSRQTETNDRLSVGPSVPSETPTELFRTGRWDRDGPDTSEDDTEMQWSFPVSEGETYLVRLYFAEIWLNETAPNSHEEKGPRRFDVRIDGELVMQHYDIYADVGPDRGTMKEFRLTAADDTLDVTFIHVIENPHVSGIEIVRVDNGTDADGY